jgi:nitrogen fixation-related uncharacterized protein
MSLAIAVMINVILMVAIVAVIVGHLVWAIRTQHREDLGVAIDRRLGVERRQRVARHWPPHAERRRDQGRYGKGPVTA